jgi:hypothetical protein
MVAWPPTPWQIKPKVADKNVQQFIAREQELRERRETIAYIKSKEIYVSAVLQSLPLCVPRV